MNTPPNGGPAFPFEGLRTLGESYHNGSAGMSLRAWYAGLAMQGILASESEDTGYTVTYLNGNGKETYRLESPPVIDGKEDLSKPWVPNKILRTVEQNQARAAVAAADALIAELSQPQQTTTPKP